MLTIYGKHSIGASGLFLQRDKYNREPLTSQPSAMLLVTTKRGLILICKVVEKLVVKVIAVKKDPPPGAVTGSGRTILKHPKS